MILISAVNAYIGIIREHINPPPRKLDVARESLPHAAAMNLLTGSELTRTEDDICLLMTYRRRNLSLDLGC